MIDPTIVQARITALHTERTQAAQNAAAIDRAYSAAIGELEALLVAVELPLLTRPRIARVLRRLVRGGRR